MISYDLTEIRDILDNPAELLSFNQRVLLYMLIAQQVFPDGVRIDLKYIYEGEAIMAAYRDTFKPDQTSHLA